MKLAWHNILHDRTRFVVTLLGVSFAVSLMVFQGSLLAGFLRAASRFIDATDSDIWIVPRGVRAFEFGTTLDGSLRERAAGVPGVAATSRVCMGFAVYRAPNGNQQSVAVVGADSNIGSRFPVPSPGLFAQDASPEAVLFDGSDRKLIAAANLPMEAEINDRRALLDREIHGFGGFLGVPFLFTSYSNAASYLGFSPDGAMYVVLRVAPGYSVSEVQKQLSARFPGVDVLTRQEFAYRAEKYWTIKTGAGGAILAAAILGFLIGLVVVSQTIYANTMENIEEYATLKALGGSRRFVTRTVLSEALICGGFGSVLGLFAVAPILKEAQYLIPWIHTPFWLPLAMIVPSLLMCALASIASVRTAISVEPGRVFRA